MITILKSLRLLLLLVIAGLAPSFADSAELTQGGTLQFEDQWPALGDLDFNDQTIAWNYEFTTEAGSANLVKGIRATINVLAVGATLRNGLYLHLPVPSASASSMTIDLAPGQRLLMPCPTSRSWSSP